MTKDLRTRMGLTLEQFARLLNVSYVTVWRWEKGAEPCGMSGRLIKKFMTLHVEKVVRRWREMERDYTYLLYMLLREYYVERV